jgi:hypothetical protein
MSGYIDGQIQGPILDVAVAPLLAIDAGVLEYPPSDLDDEARFLGERDYDRRCHSTSTWVIPAEESFDTVEASIVCADDGLVFDV